MRSYGETLSKLALTNDNICQQRVIAWNDHFHLDRHSRPVSIMASIDLYIGIDNAYIPVLSIPVDDCNRFALKPLRWLRFLGYAIYGNHGHISTTADGPPVDYESAIGEAHYYFASAGTSIHSC